MVSRPKTSGVQPKDMSQSGFLKSMGWRSMHEFMLSYNLRIADMEEYEEAQRIIRTFQEDAQERWEEEQAEERARQERYPLQEPGSRPRIAHGGQDEGQRQRLAAEQDIKKTYDYLRTGYELDSPGTELSYRSEPSDILACAGAKLDRGYEVAYDSSGNEIGYKYEPLNHIDGASTEPDYGYEPLNNSHYPSTQPGRHDEPAKEHGCPAFERGFTCKPENEVDYLATEFHCDYEPGYGFQRAGNALSHDHQFDFERGGYGHVQNMERGVREAVYDYYAGSQHPSYYMPDHFYQEGPYEGGSMYSPDYESREGDWHY